MKLTNVFISITMIVGIAFSSLTFSSCNGKNEVASYFNNAAKTTKEETPLPQQTDETTTWVDVKYNEKENVYEYVYEINVPFTEKLPSSQVQEMKNAMLPIMVEAIKMEGDFYDKVKQYKTTLRFVYISNDGKEFCNFKILPSELD